MFQIMEKVNLNAHEFLHHTLCRVILHLLEIKKTTRIINPIKTNAQNSLFDLFQWLPFATKPASQPEELF